MIWIENLEIHDGRNLERLNQTQSEKKEKTIKSTSKTLTKR